MGILQWRINGRKLLPPLGLAVALATAVFLGMWLGVRDAIERLQWDGIPPSKIIEFYYFIPQSLGLVLFVIMILALALIYLGHWYWWVTGPAILVLFALAPYYTVYWLIKAEMGSSLSLAYEDSGLINDPISIASSAFVMSILAVLLIHAVRWMIRDAKTPRT